MITLILFLVEISNYIEVLSTNNPKRSETYDRIADETGLVTLLKRHPVLWSVDTMMADLQAGTYLFNEMVKYKNTTKKQR